MSLVLIAALAASATGAPEWTKDQVVALISSSEAAGQSPNPEAAFTDVAGGAYGYRRQTGESNESMARRVLRRLQKGHPEVRHGQWLSALARRFYADVGERARTHARFERERRMRTYLEAKAEQASATAAQIAPTIEIKIPGMEGYVAPLAVADGDEPDTHGATAFVHGQRITIEHLDRVTFEDHRPPPNAPRTPQGALRELVAAQKQFNTHSEMFARIDKEKARGRRVLRVFVGAAWPAVYLNELVRAAQEAKMRTMFLMTLSPGEPRLRQIEISLQTPTTKKGKRAPEPVMCKDPVLMQRCVESIAEVRTTSKRLYYKLPD